TPILSLHDALPISLLAPLAGDVAVEPVGDENDDEQRDVDDVPPGVGLVGNGDNDYQQEESAERYQVRHRRIISVMAPAQALAGTVARGPVGGRGGSRRGLQWGFLMPHVRMRSLSVVGRMPSNSAAPPLPDTRQLACLSAARMFFFCSAFSSFSVSTLSCGGSVSRCFAVPLAAAVSGRDSSSRRTLPCDRMTARSMTFF